MTYAPAEPADLTCSILFFILQTYHCRRSPEGAAPPHRLLHQPAQRRCTGEPRRSTPRTAAQLYLHQRLFRLRQLCRQLQDSRGLLLRPGPHPYRGPDPGRRAGRRPLYHRQRLHGQGAITLCTSTSSGLGQSSQLLAKAADNGEWQDGQRFSSSASEDEVRTWAKTCSANSGAIE